MNRIEFMGMPRAGKSTQLELLETILKHEKFCIRSIYEGARVCPLDKKDRFLYHTWSFHNTINRIMEVQPNHFDYLLIDRGVYDHIAFTQALYKTGQITKEQHKSQIKYFEEFRFLEDLALIFMISPEEAMRRENKHHKFTGRVMNNNFLSILYESYKEIASTIRQDYFLIDGFKPVEDNGNEILEFMRKYQLPHKSSVI